MSLILYTKEHEWVSIEGDTGVIGITDYAQRELGEVVYVEVPEVGDTFSKGDEFGSVESVKAVSDLYMPLTGRIIEANGELEDNPELVNDDPEGEGWIIKIQIENPEEIDALLNEEQYKDLIT